MLTSTNHAGITPQDEREDEEEDAKEEAALKMKTNTTERKKTAEDDLHTPSNGVV